MSSRGARRVADGAPGLPGEDLRDLVVVERFGPRDRQAASLPARSEQHPSRRSPHVPRIHEAHATRSRVEVDRSAPHALGIGGVVVLHEVIRAQVGPHQALGLHVLLQSTADGLLAPEGRQPGDGGDALDSRSRGRAGDALHHLALAAVAGLGRHEQERSRIPHQGSEPARVLQVERGDPGIRSEHHPGARRVAARRDEVRSPRQQLGHGSAPHRARRAHHEDPAFRHARKARIRGPSCPIPQQRTERGRGPEEAWR